MCPGTVARTHEVRAAMLCVKGLSAHTAPYRVCRGCVRVRLASHAAACMHGVGRVLFPGEVVFPDDIPQGASASRASRSTDLHISVCVVRCGGMRWFARPVILGRREPTPGVVPSCDVPLRSVLWYATCSAALGECLCWVWAAHAQQPWRFGPRLSYRHRADQCTCSRAVHAASLGPAASAEALWLAP